MYFYAMFCYYCAITDNTTTLQLGLLYGINPQPYLVSAFSVKLIARPTLFWSFLGNKLKWQILAKNLSSSSSFNYYKRMNLKNCPYLKKLDNFLPVTFYLTPPVQLGTKEYLILTFSVKKYPVGPYFGLFNEINILPNLLSVFSIE